MPEAFPPRGRRWPRGCAQARRRPGRHRRRPVAGNADAVLALRRGHRDADRLVIIEEAPDHLGEPDSPAAEVFARAPRRARARTPGSPSARFEPRKNLGRLLEAYAVASAEAPDPLADAGMGPSRVGTLEQSRGSRESAGVVFAGRRRRQVWLAGSTAERAVVLRPHRGGLRPAVVESMAEGTPVVSSPVPSSGGASLEVDPTNVASIAEGLRGRLPPTRRRGQASSQAVFRVRALFVGEHCASTPSGLGACRLARAGSAMTTGPSAGALTVALDVSASPEPARRGRAGTFGRSWRAPSRGADGLRAHALAAGGTTGRGGLSQRRGRGLSRSHLSGA